MSGNLLQITTIPISIEIKITNAKLELADDRQPKVNVTTKNGGFVMQAEPLKINIDTSGKKKPWLRSYDRW